MIRFALPLLALAATGCTYGARPETAAPASGKCSKAAVSGLIGKQRSDEVGAEALRLSRAETLRWIAPGTMVTKDYREERLNLDVDADGRIVSASCG